MKERSSAHYLFDRPQNRKRVVRALIALCFLLLALEGILHRHVVHAWEGLFGFYALYGFVACVLLVLLAKEMRKLLMRDEDYYRRGSGEHPESPRPTGEDRDA